MSGKRSGEILGLTWDQINFAKPMPTFVREKPEAGQGGKSRRMQNSAAEAISLGRKSPSVVGLPTKVPTQQNLISSGGIDEIRTAFYVVPGAGLEPALPFRENGF